MDLLQRERYTDTGLPCSVYSERRWLFTECRGAETFEVWFSCAVGCSAYNLRRYNCSLQLQFELHTVAYGS